MSPKPVALVTGGAGGIGAAVAARLQRDGFRVAILDLDNASVAAAVDASNADGEVVGLVTDVRDSGGVATAVSDVVNRWGRIDALVNSAGTGGAARFETISNEHWDRTLGVNLTGAFLLCREVLPVMRRQRSGAIVNIASIAAKRISYNGDAAYTAAKSGLLGLTRHLAFEAANDGISVNALCPGPTATPMMDAMDAGVIEARRRSVPMGRFVTPEEIAAATAFFVSREATMVTGAALDIDGGALLGWMGTDEYFRSRT